MVRKHIVFIPSWFSLDTPEGVFICEHARMTAAMGHQVGFLSVQRNSLLSRTALKWWTAEQVQYVLMQSWHLPKVPGLIIMWKHCFEMLYNSYVRRFGIPDLIHAHGYVAGIAARHLSMKYEIPFIVTEHSTAIPLNRVAWYHVTELRHVYRDARKLIAVSKFLATAMQHWVTRSDIQRIFNPVDCHRFMPRPKPSRDFIQLICIGSLDPRKNIGALIQAIFEIKEQFRIKLLVVGSGPQLAKLKSLASTLDIVDEIQWLGDLTPADVAAYLASSDLLVSTSLLETFGVVIAEALACGVPVIATDSGGPQEYLSADVGVLVPINNPTALTKALQNTLQNLSQYDPVTIRKYACDQFDFPVIGTQVDRIYNEVVATTVQS